MKIFIPVNVSNRQGELLNKYFGNLVKEAAVDRPEIIEGVHERSASKDRRGIS